MKSRQLSSCTSPLEHRSDSSSSAFRQISSSLSADIALQHPSDWSATPADLPPAPLSHTHTPSLSHTRARARVPRKRRTRGAAATPLDRFRALDALAKSTETTLLLLLPLVLSCLSAFLFCLPVLLFCAFCPPLLAEAESPLSLQASAAPVKVFEWTLGFHCAQLFLGALGCGETDRKFCLHQPSHNPQPPPPAPPLRHPSSREAGEASPRRKHCEILK